MELRSLKLPLSAISSHHAENYFVVNKENHIIRRRQYFQQQDRYHEQRLHDSVKALHPDAWGVGQLQLDRDALHKNTLRLLDLGLVFQDGEIYDEPGADELRPEIGLSNIPQSQQALTFYAALPTFEHFGGNSRRARPPSSTWAIWCIKRRARPRGAAIAGMDLNCAPMRAPCCARVKAC